MTTAELVTLLEHAYDGDPWHGPSVHAVLDGIDAATAAARPLTERHTIWELVLHMTAWTREVERRIDGHAPGEPLDGDWPAAMVIDDEAWHLARRALAEAHAALVASVSQHGDDRWATRIGDARDPALGTSVALARWLSGWRRTTPITPVRSHCSSVVHNPRSGASDSLDNRITMAAVARMVANHETLPLAVRRVRPGHCARMGASLAAVDYVAGPDAQSFQRLRSA